MTLLKGPYKFHTSLSKLKHSLILRFFIFFQSIFSHLQGKKQEGIAHLERVASLREPDEPRSKVHYFDGLVLLARYGSSYCICLGSFCFV